MKRNFLFLILSIFITFILPAYADESPEEILKAIVKIRSIIPKDAHTASILGTEREGNGVVIDSEGTILTIGYLILEAETVEVIGPEGKPINATFVGYDPNTGFGLLRTQKPLNVVPMKVGRSSTVKEGDPVLVAGHGGIESVIIARVITRYEFVGYWEYLIEDAIFTTPPYPFFSGAALISLDGQLLGIGSFFTQLIVQGVGLIPSNLFVPIDLLNPILDDLKTKGLSPKVQRPWLGITAREVYGRVFITNITSGGPAERAGLQPDDLILSVNGRKVNGLADFYRKVWALGNAGVDVLLSILRGTLIQDITVHSADNYQFLVLKPKNT